MKTNFVYLLKNETMIKYFYSIVVALLFYPLISNASIQKDGIFEGQIVDIINR